MKLNTLYLLGLSLALASCSNEKEASTDTKQTGQTPLEKLVLETAPDKSLEIAALRTTAKLGDKVTFTGDVIGSNAVFMDGRAVMVMGDPKKLTPCNKIEGDECPTPWDVCCDDPDVITASIVTVQVVDDSGKPVKSSLKGLNGLKELSTVTVTGEVSGTASETNMLVNASGIYVHPVK